MFTRKKRKTLQTLYNDMDELWQKFLKAKAYFPYLNESAIGKNSLGSSDFDQMFGISMWLKFSKNLTKREIEDINEIGYYINQNFIVRLFALLQSYGVTDDLPNFKNYKYYEYIEVLTLLRNCFAHSSGFYNPANRNHRKAIEKIKELFGVEQIKEDWFPIPKDRVIFKIFSGVKEFTKLRFLIKKEKLLI